ncbi:MAG: preprotein translocase subunit SecG [Lentisphaeria bacterium]|nr:preprotein translocase subunit SecG [Lentisphaeria bacterium]
MGSLIIALYVLEVLVSVMLIGIVLIQQSKSQGGLGALAGGQTESVFGAATGNVITKATVTLAAVFLANTLVLAILTSQAGATAKAASRAEALAKDTPMSQDADGSAADGTMGGTTEDAAEDAAAGTADGDTETGVDEAADKSAETPDEATDTPTE